MTTYEEARYRWPGTVLLGIRQPHGERFVQFADEVVAIDVDEVNRLIAAEAARLRGKGRLTGDPEPIAVSADGLLVLDEDHTYRLVRRDRLRPHIAVFER